MRKLKCCLLFLVASVALATHSCYQHKENTYYFSNGEVMQRNEIPQFLKDRFDSLGYGSGGYHIFSSLDQNFQHKFRALSQRHNDSLSSYLRSEEDLDSIPLDQDLFSSAHIIIENETGRIVSYQGFGNGWDNVQESTHLGSLHKSYLYGLALEKEFAHEDDYPIMAYDIKSGNYKLDTTLCIPINYSFSHSLSVPLQGLEKQYSIGEQLEFVKRLGCSSTDTFEMHPMYMKMSLFDICHSHQTFCNNGFKIQSSLIDSITNHNNVIVYKNQIKSAKVLDDSTANEIFELLRYYMRGGHHSTIVRHYGYNKKLAGRFGDIHNFWICWLVCSTETHTIAIRSDFEYPTIRLRGINKWSARARITPLWSRMLIELEKEP